eukprot:9484282-Pyramimonas_sp.AAC.1
MVSRSPRGMMPCLTASRHRDIAGGWRLQAGGLTIMSYISVSAYAVPFGVTSALCASCATHQAEGAIGQSMCPNSGFASPTATVRRRRRDDDE